MSSEPARYDAIADWYIEFTKDWDSEPLALLPDDLRGLRSWTWPVATAGPAGTWPSEGRESVVLISRPPCCPGHGSWKPSSPSGSATSAATQPLPTGGTGWPTTACCATWRSWTSTTWRAPSPPSPRCSPRVGGSASRCSTRAIREGPRDRGPGFRAGPGARLLLEGRWSTDGKGIRDRAGVNHRMLSTYLNAVLRAGLVLEELAERETSVPVTLIARCERQG